jgi:hypothetical protein
MKYACMVLTISIEMTRAIGTMFWKSTKAALFRCHGCHFPREGAHAKLMTDWATTLVAPSFPSSKKSADVASRSM